MHTKILDLLNMAKSVVLCTHRQADGDGLGAELGMYHALKKIGKQVRILNVDKTPKRYEFLGTQELISYFEGQHEILENTDLALIFDTNDNRLLGPLFPELKKKCKYIAFVDHHPTLKEGPLPTVESYVDITAASTGELAYTLITNLNIELDPLIARAIYTSIAFDTQMFRYVRNSPRSHQIASELLQYEKHPEEVHRSLFGHHTVEKIQFLSKALGHIEFHCNNQLALLKISLNDLEQAHLEMDDSRDLIDLIMNIASLEIAVLIREETANTFKISIRSKGDIAVLDVAEKFGGGGHAFSSGAFIICPYADLKAQLIEDIKYLIENSPLPSRKSN